MDRNAKCCSTCTHTCWLVHGRKRSSPVVASFFKVMLGDDFSKVLFLPPKFASEMSGLVGESAFLEDSNGKQWEVTFSNVNGSLAFHHGWSNFASSHDLEIGDFVVFFQLMESLFVVKIYDRTACERVSFSKKGYKRKRMRDDGNSTRKDGPPRTSNTSCSDIEVYCMVNRNLGEEQGEERICNIDLSLFEKWSYSGREGMSKAGVISRISPLQAVKSVGSGALPSEKDSCITPTSWHLVPLSAAAKGKRMKVIKEEPVEIISDLCSQEAIRKLPGASNTLTLIGTKDCQSGKVMKVSKEEPVEINSNPCNQITKQNGRENAGEPMKLTKGEYFSNISMSMRQDDKVAQAVKADIVGQVVKTNRVAHVAKIDRVAQVAKMDGVAQVIKKESAHVAGSENCQSAKAPKVVKKEPMENKTAPCRESLGVTKDALLGSRVPQVVVKTESIDFDGSSPTFSPHSRFPQAAVKTEIVDLDESSPTFSPLVATSSESYVELPEYLPFPTTKGRANVERKTVILRDPAKRLWPVMYHDKPGLRVLAFGWGNFSKANCIKSGDQCRFTLEDESDGIYAVTLVPR